MNKLFNCYASSAFGMESLIAKELKELGALDVLTENGGVRFSADSEELFRFNLKMHFCDRLYIVLASDICRSYDYLFNMVFGVDWSPFFAGSESIDVSCKCTRSTLMSPRDCQSIVKKAIIEKVRRTTCRFVFPETGPSLPVHITIRNDHASIMLNTSGVALSRRGYRTWNGEAPIRETLAAALVSLSGWSPGQALHDPCCGTGTILVEAAMMAAGRAPGLKRLFAMESFPCFSSIPFGQIRSELDRMANFSRIYSIGGSDIDSEALSLARKHLIQAALDINRVSLMNIPLQELNLDAEYGVFICNPPYGKRLGDQNRCRVLYHDLFDLKKRHPTWRLCVISSDPAFERSYGKRADKKRRLYNGRLECVYYLYF